MDKVDDDDERDFFEDEGFNLPTRDSMVMSGFMDEEHERDSIDDEYNSGDDDEDEDDHGCLVFDVLDTKKN